MDVGDGVTGVYTVYGASVGHTTLTASVKLPTGQVIHSTPKPLEVFPPLRLEPKNITLIIGAVLQVRHCLIERKYSYIQNCFTKSAFVN